MKLILTTLDGNIFSVEVSADIELINLKALCEQETKIETGKISLTHNGKILAGDSEPLSSFNLVDNDILMVQKMASK